MPNDHAVVIAGAGPTGSMLAAELTLAGADVVVVEPQRGQRDGGSRAGGLHARTIEVLDQRGIADRFLSQGTPMQVAMFAMAPLDISDFPARHNYGLALWQNKFEEILGEWVAELGVPIRRGVAVTGLAQDGDGVDVALSDGSSLRAAYVVGCDGGRSVVRKAAGIAFPGWEASRSTIVAEAELAEEPPFGVRHGAKGVHGMGPLDGGRVRLVVTENEIGRSGDATLDELRAALLDAYGTDFGVRDATWISRFTDATRHAAAYRERRVLLAGDAAHVHYPAGGQGLNLGLQDAVNLGWKLAQVVHGTSPDSLLDTYQAERHPVTARVLRTTMAQTALQGAGDRLDALRAELAELVVMDEPRRHLGGLMSGLDVRYDLGEGHPLLGRRMPDLDLATPEGSRRVFALLHEARPVLLNLGVPGAIDAGPWRVPLVEASYDGPWELPVVGAVPAPDAVLVRPDGYVAWVGDGTDAGLRAALVRWFGPVTS